MLNCDLACFSRINFFRFILSLRLVYIFEIYVKFCVFWYPKSQNCEQKFSDPYTVNDPNCRDQRWRGHWVKIIFFSFSLLFKGIQQPSGYACWKCKKSQNSTHPTVQCTVQYMLNAPCLSLPLGQVRLGAGHQDHGELWRLLRHPLSTTQTRYLTSLFIIVVS
jgi:hypothetical protein